MQRYFNTEGQCEPEDHYMVRLDERLEEIKTRYVDSGKYFVINRGRQYGKTTTLRALARYLKDRYIVIDMDFQLMSAANFANEQMFCAKFIEYMEDLLSRKEALETVIDLDSLNALLSLKNLETISLDMLFDRISRMCEKSKKPFVLMIDEVDSASNNEVFIEFLAQLRGYYLNRKNRATFQSVILAGIYDIKNLKLKIRPDEAHQYNSPWNIAADFKIEMSFSVEQIRAMLEEYEAEHHTGMDLTAVAQDIYGYTSGYPYLVSAICKDLDEEITDAWTREGIIEAVKLLLNKNIPLFGSMVRHISEYPDLKNMLHAMLFLGEQVAYNPDNKMIDLACMFGYTVNDHGSVRMANRIFEMRLYNLFLSEEELASIISKKAKQDKNQFVSDGRLDMDRVLEKFVEYFTEICGDKDERFIEKQGRKIFLIYLKPIINGTGNYYIEAETRDERRTDVIVDYKGEQFILELKIWHGNEYNERGEKQLTEYLDYYHKDKGYMLSFNFNKNKKAGIKEVTIGDKLLIEAVV